MSVAPYTMNVKKRYDARGLDAATRLFLRYAKKHGMTFDQGFGNDYGTMGWSRYLGPGKCYVAGARGVQLEWRTKSDGSDAITLHVWKH